MAETIFFGKPKIIMSKCIEFDNCTHDGSKVSSNIVSKLVDYAEFITVCPEVELGLGIPRDYTRLVTFDEKPQLMQPNHGKNLTEEVTAFANKFIQNVSTVDAFVFKHKSPTCGIRSVRIYSSLIRKAPFSSKARGLFAGKVLEAFPDVLTTDEDYLLNKSHRHHFLTSLFCRASFREQKETGTLEALQNFHESNSLLFLLYNQNLNRQMLRLCSKRCDMTIGDIWKRYERLLFNLFSKKPTRSSTQGLLSSLHDTIKPYISETEKEKYTELANKYCSKNFSYDECINALKSIIKNHPESGIADQTIFLPYPESIS